MAIILDGNAGISFNDATSQNTSAVVSGKQPYSQMPAGSVLQVVNISTIGYSTASTNSWIDVPNLTLAITPRYSTSKILVMIKLSSIGHAVGTTYCNLRLVRDGSTVTNFENAGGWTSTSTENCVGAGFDYLDSPATTSATTYKVQFTSGNNTAYGQVGNYVASSSDSKHSLVLMEIAQ